MSGIFGAVSPDDCSQILFHGTDYHSHLGTQFGGLAVLNNGGIRRKIHDISGSQFKSKFDVEMARLKGSSGIGVVCAGEEQPILLNSRFGPFAICTNGRIRNAEALTSRLLSEGVSFSEVGTTPVNGAELAAKLVAQGRDLVSGIQRVFDCIEGSCSMLILHADGLYAARDRLGSSPLVLGRRGADYAVTTETCAFPNLGFETIKYLEPGEIALVNRRGVYQRATGGPHKQICSFLWIYTGFPASTYEGVNAEVVRERCGRALARRDRVEADLVAGVPDSGVGHAIGYAMESGLPYRRPLVKYTPGYGRSYTPVDQSTRDHVARMKLIPIREIIDGQRIVLCEDSIVRGTQLKNYTIQKLWECGAREVHVRAACPPLMFPCEFNQSTRELAELAARRAIQALGGDSGGDIAAFLDPSSEEYRRMTQWIAHDLGVTSLAYLTVQDMVEAIGLPREQICLHCWQGNGRRACACQSEAGAEQVGAARSCLSE